MLCVFVNYIIFLSLIMDGNACIKASKKYCESCRQMVGCGTHQTMDVMCCIKDE